MGSTGTSRVSDAPFGVGRDKGLERPDVFSHVTDPMNTPLSCREATGAGIGRNSRRLINLAPSTASSSRSSPETTTIPLSFEMGLLGRSLEERQVMY